SNLWLPALAPLGLRQVVLCRTAGTRGLLPPRYHRDPLHPPVRCMLIGASAMQRDKVLPLERVPDLVPSGATIMVGGFGLVGAPTHVLDALAASTVRALTVISNNLGEPGLGLGRFLRNGQVRHAIGSYFTSNAEVVRAVQEGRLTVEVLPQGTLAEAMRA